MITTFAETARTSIQERSSAPKESRARDAALLEAVASQARHDNFPVALRILPESLRKHLMAVYGFARLADDLGDEYPGDRTEALNWLEGQIDALYAGSPQHPIFRRLAPTVARFDIPRTPLDRLLAANRMDQTKKRYQNWAELMEYCSLSANPVGHMVLAILEADTPSRRAASDSVCSALQVIEHVGDIAEDAAAGRVYVPAEVLEGFGCSEMELMSRAASPSLVGVVAYLETRAREMLEPGRALVQSLQGYARLSVAGFVAGGLAALDAIVAVRYDVLGTPVRRSRLGTAAHMVRLCVSDLTCSQVRDSSRAPSSRAPSSRAVSLFAAESPVGRLLCSSGCPTKIKHPI